MNVTSIRPSIHILGAGSIGQLWAISIRSKIPSYGVTLILRGKGDDPTPTNQTFFWKYPDGEKPREVTIPVVYNTGSGGSDLGRIDTLLVTTKSYQAKDAIKSVLQACSPSRVVLLCNGALSVREELLPILKDADIPLILATTTHGAYRDTTTSPSSPNKLESCLVHAGVGKTFIQDQASDLSLLWNEAGLNCSTLTESEMDQLLWKKLAANCVVNPLTALFRCLNGELWMEPSFFELQQEILHEVAQVAQACIETTTATTAPSTDSNLDAASLRQFVNQVIQDTRENKSSMLQDVLQSRRTEIDHLNKYIVQKGRSLGIDCPVNEDLVERIHELPYKQFKP